MSLNGSLTVSGLPGAASLVGDSNSGNCSCAIGMLLCSCCAMSGIICPVGYVVLNVCC